MPAIFCACLVLMTFVSFQVQFTILKGDPRLPIMAVLAPFLSFLPVCFFLVGTSLSQLRQENRDLRAQLQELLSKSGVVK